MPFFATCPVHGRFAARNLFGGSTSFVLSGTTTSCPICGNQSPIDDGTYDVVGSVVKAFRAKDVTPEQIESFRTIAEDVAVGTLSSAEATEQIAAFAPAIQALWKWVSENNQAINLLVSIIALYVAIQSGSSDDDAAASQLRATQAQTELLSEQLNEARAQTDLIARIHTQLRSQADTPKAEIRYEPSDSNVRPSPNRHERRKAARRALRKAKPTG